MKKLEHVELSFHLPFYEIYFPADNFDESLPKKPTELLELCQEMIMKIDLDLLLLEFETTKTNQGDIYIFYASNKKDSFIYFDFHKESTDQMAVIQLGVCIKTEEKTVIKKN